MGSDLALFMKNLFLCHYERKGKKKKKHVKGWKYFQIFLGLWMIYALSTRANLKIISMRFILRKLKIVVKPHNLSIEVHDKKFTTKLFDEIPF